MMREKCVLCDSILEEIFKIEEMPSFMGVVKNDINIIENDMIVGECVSCGLIQNMILPNLEIVYMNNHNTEIVGVIWEEHYIELCKFIKKNSVGSVIFEIGDPSAKLAKHLNSNYDKWIIMEPNTKISDFDNVEIINGFFEGINPTNYDVTTIVHSHVLEHIYDPVVFLKNCNNILPIGGVTIFSIPNMRWLLENNSLPTSVLHFEHTYYIDDNNVELFLNNAGFVLDDIYYYKDHSIFIKATKMIPNKKIINRVGYSVDFLKLVDYHKNNINEINIKLDGREYYLYSAHINSQFMIKNGIDLNIKGFLDNSKSKIGMKLYGYPYDIYDPNLITHDESPIVVVSHMSVYYEEIKNKLKQINKNVIII